MAERWYRRQRARALRALAATLGPRPNPFVRAALDGAAALARFSRFERIARENLELALQGADHRAILRGVRRHAARLAREWMLLSRAASGGERAREVDAWLARTVEIDRSIEILERERARGRGLLLVTAHLGNWELCAIALARRGLTGAVVGRAKPNDPIAAWFLEMRSALGVPTIDQTASARAMLAVLARGETLGLVCDLAPRRIAGEPVEFFGRPALAMTAPAALARAARVPLVPVRCVAHGERYRLSVDEPLELDRALARDAARTELTQRMMRTFERWIRETPEQWAWHQRRWRVDERSRRPPAVARKQRGERSSPG